MPSLLFTSGLGASGFDLLQLGPRPFDFFDNVFHLRRPDKWLGLLVPSLQKTVNGREQIGDADKAAATNRLLTEFLEPSLHQVEPTGAGRYEVADKAWMLFEPSLHMGFFMRAVIVHHTMQLQVRRKFPV